MDLFQNLHNESYHSKKSSELNKVLQKLFRKYAPVRSCESDNDYQQERSKLNQDCYDLLCLFLGKPPV